MQIAHNHITPSIRVSTAALRRRDPYWSDYWLVETWVFSDDPRQRSFQVCHGSWPGLYDHCLERARKVHGHITRNLELKFQGADAEGGV